jgi:hypothetical protein
MIRGVVRATPEATAQIGQNTISDLLQANSEEGLRESDSFFSGSTKSARDSLGHIDLNHRVQFSVLGI